MIKLLDIINLIKPLQIIGETDKEITELADINDANVKSTSLMWISKTYYHKIIEVNSGVIICNESPSSINRRCTYLICLNPRLAFLKVLEVYFSEKKLFGISEFAKIDSNVIIEKNVFIGDNVIIESGCKIGEGTFIGPNNIIQRNTLIGKNVKIGSFNSIGGTGFGYEKDEKGDYILMPHIGNVLIQDDVEIKNNVCIDRSVLGTTLIERNVKIDSFVHIGHNVSIGENSLLISGCQISGGVKIGKNCWISPSSSIMQKINIGNNVIVGLGSVVSRNFDSNLVVLGNPAKIVNTN